MHGKIDDIGPWSEIKLDIVKEYAQAYSTILSKKQLAYSYIDAFAGAGLHISRQTGDFVLGSPLNALNIQPPFQHYYFIDLNSEKTSTLSTFVGDRKDVTVFEGDCNVVLLEEVFPAVRYEDYRRALCLLDPYGLHLDWQVLAKAGEMRSIEVFLNFPVLDMNRNALWQNIEDLDEALQKRMQRFWGDDSWRRIAYRTDGNLFGWAEKVEDCTRVVAMAFRERLRRAAHFKYVAEPMPMRNSVGNVMYYLFFASQQPVADRIVKDILRKWSGYGSN